MSRIVALRSLVLAIRVLLAGVMTLPLTGVAHADSTSFSGQATGVKATAPVVGNVVLADTGPLPSSGGSLQTSLLNPSVPGLLTAEVFHASTVGQGDRSRSEASVANVTLTAGGYTITADFLRSNAMAVCGPDGASATGSSEIANLSVNNTDIAVSGQPNQAVTLPTLPDGTTGTIVINEQQHQGPGSITVNALHVTVTNATVGTTDVVIASAHADITCPSSVVNCTGGDFVTGGGYIITPSGAKGNFAVAGGKTPGWGHLEYIDHGTGLKVHGTGVTNYVVTGPNSREIDGTADINGAPGTYTVDVVDNGNPGHGNDTFVIRLSNGYTAGEGETISGGNIQLHGPCQ